MARYVKQLWTYREPSTQHLARSNRPVTSRPVARPEPTCVRLPCAPAKPEAWWTTLPSPSAFLECQRRRAKSAWAEHAGVHGYTSKRRATERNQRRARAQNEVVQAAVFKDAQTKRRRALDFPSSLVPRRSARPLPRIAQALRRPARRRGTNRPASTSFDRRAAGARAAWRRLCGLSRVRGGNSIWISVRRLLRLQPLLTLFES